MGQVVFGIDCIHSDANMTDEKSTYFFYVFGTLQKLASDFADFSEELYDEVKDRGDRGIAAVSKESIYSLKAWV